MTIDSAKTLILASSSPRRQELIRYLRLPVRVMVSDADETTEPGLAPDRIVEELSARKAGAVFERYKAGERPAGEQGIIVGSDTIVVLGGRVLGKPRDEADAEEMLQALQGTTHEVYTGLACVDTQTGEQITAHSVTRVYMKPLTQEQIRGYIRTGEPMDKAGSYGIQGLGSVLVERIEGDYFTVVGLPLSLLSDILGRMGAAVI